MEVKDLIEILEKSENFFEQYNGTTKWSDGWKASIQGHSLEDIAVIYPKLLPLLIVSKASFKFGTQKLIDLGQNHEQSTKLLTIYIPNGIDPKSYCELVKLNLDGYSGAADIPEKKSYTKYAEGIFYRNDRDVSGEYIPA